MSEYIHCPNKIINKYNGLNKMCNLIIFSILFEYLYIWYIKFAKLYTYIYLNHDYVQLISVKIQRKVKYGNYMYDSYKKCEYRWNIKSK